MLKSILSAALNRMEKKDNYDLSYARYILQHSLSAFRRFSKLGSFSQQSEGVPTEALYAAKITSSLKADCGPCTQLVVGWAEKAKVPPAIIRAVLTRDFDRMPADIATVVRFTEAVLARDLAADPLREQIRQKWGDKAVITMAFAITTGQIFPLIKYGLGYGHACSIVNVAGAPVRVSYEMPKSLQAL